MFIAKRIKLFVNITPANKALNLQLWDSHHWTNEDNEVVYNWASESLLSLLPCYADSRYGKVGK